MPHADAREALIRAAIDTLGTPRPPAMPLREVAAAAGVTTGAVQHHFGNRRGLLLAAIDRQTEALVQRLSDVADRHPEGGLPRLRAAAFELLPLDEQRVREARLLAAFEQLAVDDEPLAAEFRKRYNLLLEMLQRDLPGGAQDAALLLSVLTGTAGDMLLRIADERDATALVDRFLAALGAN
ncbi:MULTISPECIES: TetR/AcrR family transcriptional regulator [unclassified Pseudoclavibacter]|uniref:TetR/AcrR family transcriptional regulator n=1 Tax=unclassified Pseudoclavibacter TaxID=2615177 RepID=UPI000CE85575|nr:MULTISPECIES: TetR/AcrR family transcriptional regulator [unclassified Pseudoclavibacter]MBS3179216.1 TetR/AcrR family transcriptional regulator [Pseudoclavibacter sp. Marseille-Q4354]PPG27163.1 hypothetical protein C5B97_17225 [Pseudoclavibacter sp. RFBB5]